MRPEDTKQTTPHATVGITKPLAGNRMRAQAPASRPAASITAATGPSGGNTVEASGSIPESVAINKATRKDEFNRAAVSQPRTVETARPSRCAILRAPIPAADNSRAWPITANESARRNKTDAGNTTCVTPQARQRARRGRTRPAIPRTTRVRAKPHEAKTPPHGHDGSETAGETVDTITTGATHFASSSGLRSGQGKRGSLRTNRTSLS